MLRILGKISASASSPSRCPGSANPALTEVGRTIKARVGEQSAASLAIREVDAVPATAAN